MRRVSVAIVKSKFKLNKLEIIIKLYNSLKITKHLTGFTKKSHYENKAAWS